LPKQVLPNDTIDTSGGGGKKFQTAGTGQNHRPLNVEEKQSTLRAIQYDGNVTDLVQQTDLIQLEQKWHRLRCFDVKSGPEQVDKTLEKD
jgi:hypothetical protein